MGEVSAIFYYLLIKFVTCYLVVYFIVKFDRLIGLNCLIEFEQIGVKFTFGIPGTHTTEIYDALNSSDQIEPILVTHESGASFAAGPR